MVSGNICPENSKQAKDPIKEVLARYVTKYFFELLEGDGNSRKEWENFNERRIFESRFIESVNDKLSSESELVGSIEEFQVFEAFIKVMAMQVYEEEGANIRFELRRNKKNYESETNIIEPKQSTEVSMVTLQPPPPPPPPPPLPQVYFKSFGGIPPLAPPPPPPPPSGGVFGSVSTRKSQSKVPPTAKAAQKLKISGLSHVSSNSIWAAADRDIVKEADELISQIEFEKLFCISTDQAKAQQVKIERRHSVSLTVGPKVICLLDTKRSTNISISLSQLRSISEIKDVFDRIQKADTSLSEDLLTALIKCEPSSEEIEQINEFEGDAELLNIPEKFVLEFSKTPEMSWMIRVLRYILKIPNWATELEEGVSALRDTFWILRHSQVILKLMICLRRLYELNNVIYGQQRSVQGISFEDILEFSKITSLGKSNSGSRLNMIEYLDAKIPDISEQLKKSLGNIDKAVAMEWDVLAGDLTDLKVADRFFFQKFENISHPFCESVKPFFEEWHERIQRIDSDFTDCRSAWLDLCEYFQQNSEDVKPNDFLQIWSALVNQLDQAKQNRTKNN